MKPKMCGIHENEGEREASKQARKQQRKQNDCSKLLLSSRLSFHFRLNANARLWVSGNLLSVLTAEVNESIWVMSQLNYRDRAASTFGSSSVAIINATLVFDYHILGDSAPRQYLR